MRHSSYAVSFKVAMLTNNKLI